MAASFKTLLQDDKVTTKTLMHEAIPITGTIVSGTYTALSDGREANIKTFSHGMFQSIYDYPYVSSSANHIFDLTNGFSVTSDFSASAASHTDSQVAKKVNIYNQMAQILAGFTTSSVVRQFDEDGDLSGDGGTKISSAIFLNFSRLLVKDEIKKGSFEIVLGSANSYADPFASTITVKDTDADTSYKVNSPAGEYGILKNGSTNVGLLYYQAGVAVLTSSVFASSIELDSSTNNSQALFTGSSIDSYADAVRHRIQNIKFNNTTELNSTIFFCRMNHNDFNYSSNPTYLSESTIRVKNGRGSNMPISYATTVGLYSHDNELLAVAKLSEPLRKDPTNELTLRVRLDY